MDIHIETAVALLTAAALLAPGSAAAQAQVGPRIDGPQLRVPDAPERVFDVLASARLNAGGLTVLVPGPLDLLRKFVAGVVHPFGLTQPTSERYSVHADFRDAQWQLYNPARELALDWLRVLPGLGPHGCKDVLGVVVHYQVFYRAPPMHQPVPGKPKQPPHEPAPGMRGRVAPTPEGVPAGNTPPAGLRPLTSPTAVSNIVSDGICVTLQQ